MDIEALEKLANLKEKGLITQEEFEIQKQKLMGNVPLEKMNNYPTTQQDRSDWSYYIECITTKYCCFSGRARRKEYWGFILFSTMFSLLINFFILMIGGEALMNVGSVIVNLGLLLPTLGVLVRRLHDINFSGWWASLPLFSILLLFFIAAASANHAAM